jgi:hypothetical protein
MTPPVLPRLLITAATPAADHDSIVGDLLEEYTRRVQSIGRVRSDLWYWSQAIRSVPPLLSYSRAPGSLGARVAAAVIVVGVLVAMLFAKDLIDRVIDAVYPTTGVHAWLYFLLDWADAALFGAILARVVRHHPVRLALIASATLVAGFAIPVVAGFSNGLTPIAWLLLLGAIPAMSAGAAAYQTVRKH